MSISLKRPRQQRRAWLARPRPGALRQWAETLPLDRPEQALDAINRRLRSLNFTAMGARRRLQCLAPLQRPVRHLNRSLAESMVNERMPAHPDLAHRLVQLSETWARLSVGYLCAVDQMGRREGRLAREATLRALQSLGRLLLARSQVYAPPPAGTWQAIHYCRSALHGDMRPVAPGEDGDAADTDTAYKQLLILGGIGPHRLRPSEQVALYQVLANWAQQVSVRPLRGAKPKAPPLVFRPGEDEAPRLYPQDHAPDSPGLRMIDPAPLAGRARHRLSLLEAGQHGARLSGAPLEADTLRALLNAWSASPSRRFPRAEKNQNGEMVLGLETCWRAIAGHDGMAMNCRVTNQSAGGIQATIHAPIPQTIAVGEVLAIRQDGEWRPGVVRWLRQPDPDSILLGIETVARRARALELALDGHGVRIPALLLEENRAAESPSTLLTPRCPIHEHTTITTVEGDSLQVGRCLERTAGYSRYRIGGNA